MAEDSKAAAVEWKNKGNGFLKSQDFDEAIKCYTKAIELDASNHVFYSNRSAAYLSKGDAAAALADGEACIKANPGWAKGYSRKGAALQALGKFEDAVATFNAGLAKDGSSAMLKDGLKGAQEAQAKAERQARSPFGPNMVARLATHPKFREYLADPTYMTQLQMLQSNPQNLGMMQNDPRMMETLSFLLGIDLQGAGGPGGAPGAAPTPASAPAAAPAPSSGGKTEEPSPAEPEDEEMSAEELVVRERKAKALAKKEEGNAHYKKKEFDEALACYDAAYELDDENVLVLNNKAAVYFAQKDYDKCVETCRAAIERGRELMTSFTTIAKIFARIGNALHKKGDLAGAVEAYDSSLMESHSDDVYARRKKVLRLKKKRDEEAYWDDDKAEEAKERGNTAFKAGNWPEAIKEYTEATKRNPRNPKYWQNRATARMKVMDYMSALSDAEQAIKVDPTYVKGYYRKGLVQTAMKEYHKAITTFEAGLKLDPEDNGCKEGLRQTMQRINAASASGEVDKERAARAMADPEIQAILRDPIVQQTLKDCQADPSRLQKALMDPSMGPKIMKLRSAGILQMR